MTPGHMFLALRVAALAGAGLIGGCASDCGADWYELGARDGRLGVQPQLELYAARCHVQADPQRYMDGWQTFYERPVPLW
jgi:hypothetical protein